MAVIELGLVNPDTDEPLPEPDRPFRWPDRRRVLAALVAVCCVLTVTGSTRPEPHELTELWSTPLRRDTDTFRLTGDSVFMINQEGGPRLTGYDARTGAVRWSTAEIEERAWLDTAGAGVILVPTGFTTVKHQEPDGSESSQEINRDTMALDTTTGRRLWRQRGEVAAPLGDRALMAEWNETGERVRRLRVISLHDGTTVWSRPIGDAQFWTTDPTPGVTVDRLVTVTPQGKAEVISLVDGAVLTTGRIPWNPQSENDDYTTATVQGRQLYVDQMRQGRSTVAVYDTDTLRLLWQVTLAPPGGSYTCGAVVCLTDVNGIAGHDRNTGRLLWRLPGAVNVYPHTGGRLVVDEEAGARRSLHDAATGRRLVDLGVAMPVLDAVGRVTPYVIARTTEPAGRTSVGIFDSETAKVLLRGTIAPISDNSCQLGGRLLACQTNDNRLIVTDVG